MEQGVNLNTEPNQDKLPSGRIPTLDGVRGLAILAVLVYHFADQFKLDFVSGAEKTVLAVCLSGWIGVDLFFVLSGFLITGILCDTKGSSNYFRSFFGRRFLRIFPLYYAFLFLVCFAGPAVSSSLAERAHLMRSDVAWYLAYLSNFLVAVRGKFNHVDAGYLWSLAVEEQFYLVWPVMILLLRRRGLVTLITCLFAGSLLLRLWALSRGVSVDAVYAIPFTHLESLTMGSLLAIALRTNLNRKMLSACLSAAAVLSLIAVLTIGVTRGNFKFYDATVAKWGVTLCAIVFGYVVWSSVLIAANPRSTHYRWLASPFLRSFGKYSYCIYLVHVPVGEAMEMFIFDPTQHMVLGSLLPSFAVFTALAVTASWIVGFLSWRLFEVQILKFKDTLFAVRRD